MADYEAGPNGGVIEKGSQDVKPTVQDIAAPDAAKPEESTAGAASSDVQAMTAGETAEASDAAAADATASEAASDAEKTEEAAKDGEDCAKDGGGEAAE